MAGKRAVAATMDPPAGLSDADGLTDDDEQELDDIEAVIAQVADEAATVQVKRWNPAPDDPGRPWDYITTVAAREFSVELIKREYGGGRYKAVTLDRSRKYVKGGTHIFNIDKMFKAAPKVDAPVTAPASPELTALNARLDQLAATLQAHNATKETLDMALKIAAVMSGGNARAAMGPEQVFSIFSHGIKLAREMGGAEGGGDGGGGEDDDDEPRDPFASALSKLAEPVARLLTSEVERRQGGTGATPPAQSSGGVVSPSSTAGPPWLRQLGPYLPQLLTLAKENADPDLYASVVLDLMERKLSAAKLAEVEEAAKDPAFVATVLAALPASCVPFTRWFESLLQRLRGLFLLPPEASAGEEEPEEEPAT